MVLLFLIAVFLTPSDIWCQIVVCLFIYLIIELTTFYALIIRVYKKRGLTHKLKCLDHKPINVARVWLRHMHSLTHSIKLNVLGVAQLWKQQL
jgi:hypothetical protein